MHTQKHTHNTETPPIPFGKLFHDAIYLLSFPWKSESFKKFTDCIIKLHSWKLHGIYISMHHSKGKLFVLTQIITNHSLKYQSVTESYFNVELEGLRMKRNRNINHSSHDRLTFMLVLAPAWKFRWVRFKNLPCPSCESFSEIGQLKQVYSPPTYLISDTLCPWLVSG